jgi:hypothetical protein
MHRWVVGLPPLAALLLCLPGILHAQSPERREAPKEPGSEWKAIACTIDTPNNLRGLVMAISFSESGKINYNGVQRSGAVTPTGIRFCYYSQITNQSCLSISRVSGQFTLTIPFGYAHGTCAAANTPSASRP